MVMLLFFLSNNLFFFHLLCNFLYVVCCIFWETIADDVILDFLCAYFAHHIICTSNCWIIYHSIMLILNKDVIATVFSWREIDFGEIRSITLVVFLSLSKECIVVAFILNLFSSFWVSKGMFVNAGEVLGVSGSSGMSTGPHLHLTTKKDGKVFDPVILLKYVRELLEISL